MARRAAVNDALLIGDIVTALAVECATSSVVERPALTFALLAPSAFALLLRRSRPAAMVAVLGVSYVASGLTASSIADMTSTLPPVVVVAWNAGRYADARELRWCIGIFAVTVVLVDLLGDHTTPGDFAFPTILIVLSMAVGRTLRNRALVAVELAERTERLAHERELRAAEAAHEERRRIARELHDVVAHTLSVMVVQAGAARRTLDRDPERAVEALETVEATGRSALGELRRLLGFVGDGGAPLEPAPTTADIAALVTRAREGGMTVGHRVEGTPGELPAGAEAAVYRIVQEALTNTFKHAGAGTWALVTLRWRDAALEVEVRDGGGDAPAPAALPSGGHGIVGMRERVALYGGSVEARPLEDGGFLVRAVIPAETAAVPA
jgi:signal transduction histidine kinase